MISVRVSGVLRGETLEVMPGTDGVSLLIAGHSGYASKGKDIVCAGVSALVQAAARMLSGRHIPLTVTRRDGVFGFEICLSSLDDAQKLMVMCSLETAVYGIEMIAGSYPDNVEISFE